MLHARSHAHMHALVRNEPLMTTPLSFKDLLPTPLIAQTMFKDKAKVIRFVIIYPVRKYQGTFRINKSRLPNQKVLKKPVKKILTKQKVCLCRRTVFIVQAVFIVGEPPRNIR